MMDDKQLNETERLARYFAERTDADLNRLVGEYVPALLAEVKQLRDALADEDAALYDRIETALDAEIDADDYTPASAASTVYNVVLPIVARYDIRTRDAEADRDRAREIAVALEQQLAEIKRLAYMGGQNGEVVRGWIIGVLERANTLDPQGQQDIHVCSPQTCGAVYNQEEDE